MNCKIGPLALALAVSLTACQASETHVFQHSSNPLPPDPALQASDLTADQLIAKSLEARGGDEQLKNIHSVTMTGKWETSDIKSSPITLMIAPGRYLRRIEARSGGTMFKVVDGQTTWEVTPQTGIAKAKAMVSKDAGRFRRLADPQGPLVDAQAKGNKVEVLGKMPWENSQVYKLKVTFPDGALNYIYLDAQSFLPVRVVNTMYVPHVEEDVDLEYIYEDYRAVDGVKWPFKERANAPQVKLKQITTWEKIEVNKPLDEAAFKMPTS